MLLHLSNYSLSPYIILWKIPPLNIKNTSRKMMKTSKAVFGGLSDTLTWSSQWPRQSHIHWVQITQFTQWSTFPLFFHPAWKPIETFFFNIHIHSFRPNAINPQKLSICQYFPPVSIVLDFSTSVKLLAFVSTFHSPKQFKFQISFLEN